MGTKPASGELATALTSLFENTPGAHVIQDDVIVAGKDKIEHDKVLHEALLTVSESGMTLNPDKCFFGNREIPFWVMIISKDGLKPNPEKVSALRYASRPRSKDELCAFLYMVQSNTGFIPNLARKTINLCKRLQKHHRFLHGIRNVRESLKILKMLLEKIIC